MKKLINIALCLVIFTGCKKEQLDDCFSRTGDNITIERPLKPFSAISIGDRFNLIISQDTEQAERILITGGENIVEGISAEVDGETLTISNCNTCNFVRSYKREITLEVFIHDIDEISVIGATSIISNDTLKLADLSIYHSALEDIDLRVDISNEIYVESINSGGTTLHGKALKIKGSIEEITNLDARDLLCEEALVDSHSPLDCYINATRLIYVGLYNKGNMYYVTEPSDLKDVHAQSSTGKLLKLP